MAPRTMSAFGKFWVLVAGDIARHASSRGLPPWCDWGSPPIVRPLLIPG